MIRLASLCNSPKGLLLRVLCTTSTRFTAGAGREKQQQRGAFPAAAAALLISQIHTDSPLHKGHSHWQNIQKSKAKLDSMRSRMMSNFYNRAWKAVKRNGNVCDLEKNKELANIYNEFIAASLPKQKFLDRLKRMQLEPEPVPVTFQFSGPSNTLFIVEADVANKNKFSRYMQKCLDKCKGFSLAIRPLLNTEFLERGIVIVEGKKKDGEEIDGLEEVEAVAIELECEEVNEIESNGAEGEDEDSTADEKGSSATSSYEFLCDPEEVSYVESKLQQSGYTVVVAEAEKFPINRVKVQEEHQAVVDKFMEMLRSHEEVKQIYTNVDYSEDGGK